MSSTSFCRFGPPTGAGATAEERAGGIADDLQSFAEANQAGEQLASALTAERDTLAASVADLGLQLAQAQADALCPEQQSAEQVAALRADLAAERARADLAGAALAKSEVRLEARPGLHDEIARLRAVLDVESKARIAADQLAAVVGAKLDAAERRAADIEAHAGKVEAGLQAQVAGLAADLADIKKREAAKVEQPAPAPKPASKPAK